MIAIILAFLDKFNFGDFIYGVFTEAEAKLSSSLILMTTGEFIINMLTTVMLIISVIATIFSGINYLKGSKELFKD